MALCVCLETRTVAWGGAEEFWSVEVYGGSWWRDSGRSEASSSGSSVSEKDRAPLRRAASRYLERCDDFRGEADAADRLPSCDGVVRAMPMLAASIWTLAGS